MYSSYSPLFKLGLLAEHASAPSRSSTSPINGDEASAIYFTLRPRKRDSAQLRSFLYLDLADRRRKSPSHRRKPSTLSKASSWTCTADTKPYDFARTDKPLFTPPVPVVRRTSKESLRNIPSPKPAPSAILPDLPLPSGPRSLLTFASPSSPRKRPASTVISSPLSPTLRIRRPASLRSESISSHDRRKSRMDALACLEGRSRAPNRVPRSSTLRNNFMSFSDDEDENSMIRKSIASIPVIQSEDLSAFADVEDEADAIVPLACKREAMSQAKPVRPAKHTRKRRSTIDSWFPLKSFIDLKDDDLSTWNWRSFIEIGGVA